MFDDRTLAGLDGHLAIGHCRYSTTGSSTWRNAQPAYRGVGDRQFALGHNGNLTNTEALAEEAGMLPGTVTSDTDLIAELLAAELAQLPEDRSDERDLELALDAVLPRLEGAFSLVLMDEGRVIGDPRPQRLPPAVPRHASTTAGSSRRRARPSTSSGATFVRELEPGEMVVIDATGPRSLRPFPDERIDPRLCLFEFVYFARPDSRLYERNVHQARVRMGEQLAEQAPVEADMVMGVPESGRAGRRGLRPAQRHPLRPGPGEEPLHRPQLHRPEPGAAGQRRAHEAQPAARRTSPASGWSWSTTRSCAAPPSGSSPGCSARPARPRSTCASRRRRWRGRASTASTPAIRDELLAYTHTVEEIREYLNVDTLAYLDLDRLVEATGAVGAGFCDACFTGNYPVAVPVTLAQARARGAGPCRRPAPPSRR